MLGNGTLARRDGTPEQVGLASSLMLKVQTNKIVFEYLLNKSNNIPDYLHLCSCSGYFFQMQLLQPTVVAGNMLPDAFKMGFSSARRSKVESQIFEFS